MFHTDQHSPGSTVFKCGCLNDCTKPTDQNLIEKPVFASFSTIFLMMLNCMLISALKRTSMSKCRHAAVVALKPVSHGFYNTRFLDPWLRAVQNPSAVSLLIMSQHISVLAFCSCLPSNWCLLVFTTLQICDRPAVSRRAKALVFSCWTELYVWEHVPWVYWSVLEF